MYQKLISLNMSALFNDIAVQLGWGEYVAYNSANKTLILAKSVELLTLNHEIKINNI